MAVSQIEEKILGRLAELTGPSNALLSASLYQVLGLSILLSRKLYRARKLRRLDITRDTRSLQLYHHIIWLAREGLSITEVYVLPYCQDGEQGPECRVMAAKLRASFYHIFCLFHNHPAISQLSKRSFESGSTPSSAKTTRGPNVQARNSTSRSPKNGRESNGNKSRRRSSKSALRDPIPSMTSETSYVTNPYAAGPRTPPSSELPPLPTEARRTPNRPPGLTPINIPATQAAASFLLPPLNFVPMAREHFDTAQHLANSLLAPTHALRLSVSLEHAAFAWDCEKEHERARRIARRTIREVYSSPDGLDDDEFADASSIVQALGGIVKRGSNDSTPRPDSQVVGLTRSATRNPPRNQPPPIDRTIAISPPDRRTNAEPSDQVRLAAIVPERLSTVPEVESIFEAPTQLPLSPPNSRLSSRTQQRRTSSASDKAAKRRAVEQAEEQHRRRSASNRSNRSARSSPHSRQATPPEGHSRVAQRSLPPRPPSTASARPTQNGVRRSDSADDRTTAIHRALRIMSSVSRAVHATPPRHNNSIVRSRIL